MRIDPNEIKNIGRDYICICNFGVYNAPFIRTKVEELQ